MAKSLAQQAQVNKKPEIKETWLFLPWLKCWRLLVCHYSSCYLWASRAVIKTTFPLELSVHVPKLLVYALVNRHICLRTDNSARHAEEGQEGFNVNIGGLHNAESGCLSEIGELTSSVLAAHTLFPLWVVFECIWSELILVGLLRL